MKYFFVFIIVGLIAITPKNAQAQKEFINEGIRSSDRINPESFNNSLFQEVLLYKINNYMDSLNLEGFESDGFLVSAAKEHAEAMAIDGDASLNGSGKHKTIQSRLIATGGSGIGNELVARVTIRISNEFISYNSLADQVLSRWVTGKYSKELLAQKYFFTGIYGAVDKSGKKIFVSMYLGNYASYKPEQSTFSSLSVQPTNKKYGLKLYNENACKNTKVKGLNVSDLQKGLSINENNEIIFKYNDIKTFKKFIKEKKDGLSVDIIQKSQFNDCSVENSADYSKMNIGYMLKPIFSKKLYKKNIAEGEGKRNKVTKLEVVLGELPTGLEAQDVEMNLMVIKNKHICNYIQPSYVEKKVYDYAPKLQIIPDTIVFNNINAYTPSPTSTELNFRIYFEKGKYDYNPEDMKPVLEALNEPSFLINKIFITAYSSLEGNQEENKILQRRRAQSIVKAFEKNQNASIVDSITTASNFKDLRTDVKGTRFEEVAFMSFDEAVEYVTSNASKMESILEKHRYADIKIWVTYDVDGNNEELYVVDQFNKAVEAKQLDKALTIQKYIIKRVLEGVYSDSSVSEMRIPQSKEFVGLNMNKLWLTQYVFMDPLNEDYMTKINNLYKLDNSNIYVDYNDVLCKILLTDIENENMQILLQNRIDALYNTSINVNFVDAVNIELQYQIMNLYKDSLGYNHPRVSNSLNKIKAILHFEDIKWDNSLKFATIFMNHGDYEYARELIEPYIFKEDVPIELLITYVTLCSKIDNKLYSNYFYYAIEKINNQDNDVFCSLLNNKLPVQTLVNTKVKDLYCKSCRK